MISKTLGTSSRKFARLRERHPSIGLFAQALYPLIVASSDDFGRLQGDAFTIKHSVWSTAPDDEVTFEAALSALSQEGLIVRYVVGEEVFLEVVDFAAHQSGLHKRTESRFPEPSGKFPEFPGDSLLREQNRRELNLTEGKGTEQKAPAARPRTFGRIDLHRWQLDALLAMLGPLAADFELDAWVFNLSALADERKLVLDRKTVWPWVQSELRAECERRGLTVATASAAPQLSRRTNQILAAVQAIQERGE